MVMSPKPEVDKELIEAYCENVYLFLELGLHEFVAVKIIANGENECLKIIEVN
jgi:hypothetical protein